MVLYSRLRPTSLSMLCTGIFSQLFVFQAAQPSAPPPPSICSWAGESSSQGGPRAGTSLSAVADLDPDTEKAQTAWQRLSSIPWCRWLRFFLPPPHTHSTIIPFCSARAKSQLCPVNLNLWHIFWTHILLLMLQRWSIQRGSRGRAGKESLALSLFENCMNESVAFGFPNSTPPVHWFPNFKKSKRHKGGMFVFF